MCVHFLDEHKVFWAQKTCLMNVTNYWVKIWSINYNYCNLRFSLLILCGSTKGYFLLNFCKAKATGQLVFKRAAQATATKKGERKSERERERHCSDFLSLSFLSWFCKRSKNLHAMPFNRKRDREPWWYHQIMESNFEYRWVLLSINKREGLDSLLRCWLIYLYFLHFKF